MGKTNFSKVEKSLEEGLIKMTSRNLLAATSQGQTQQGIPPTELLIAQLQTIERDLKKLHKLDPTLYQKLSFSRVRLKKILSHPEIITIEDWQKIEALRPELEKLKQELAAQKPFVYDDDIIEKERIIQKNRRFNINDKWLPLK